MTLEFKPFVRRPFEIEAVEITVENIEEIAPLVGELQAKDDGTPYIKVDRRLVPNIYRVYPGFWLTRMGDNIRCYAKRIFMEQFTHKTPELGSALDGVMVSPRLPKPNATAPVAPNPQVTINVSSQAARNGAGMIPPPPGPAR